MPAQILKSPGTWRALRDVVLIVAVLTITKSVLLRIEALWSYAGPIALALALAVAYWRLRVSGEGWRDIGMGRPRSLAMTAVWTLIALVLTILAGSLAQILANTLLGGPDEARQAIDARYQGRFAGVPGHLPSYLLWLAISWSVGAFIEEALFRGALFRRLEQVCAGFFWPGVLAALLQGVLFGQQHFYYQGVTGWVANGLIGFISALLFLVFRRNLWPLVISHGLANTLGLTLLYTQGVA